MNEDTSAAVERQTKITVSVDILELLFSRLHAHYNYLLVLASCYREEDADMLFELPVPIIEGC